LGQVLGNKREGSVSQYIHVLAAASSETLYLLEIFEHFGEFSGSSWQQGTFSVWQSFPIKSIEPWMLDDLLESIFKFGTVLGRSDSRFGPSQQATQKVDTFGGQVGLGFGGQFQTLSPTQNLSAGSHGIFRIKGGVSNQAFKHDDSERPPIDCRRVGITRSAILRGQYLGSNVIGSTNR
jgi:hypothetical protein